MAGGGVQLDGPPTQSALVTAVFAFNLIVGVGALALPYSMNEVGWLLGLALILLVAVLGYVSATFVMEAIANTSALKALDEKNQHGSELPENALLPTATTPSYSVVATSESEHDRLFRYRHLELSSMSTALFPRWGQIAFYVVICIYLYGDLAIYAVAVPKILHHVSGVNYNIFLAGFAVCMVPWVFFDFQKTKYLQLLTLTTRNVALFSMIIATMIFLGQGKGNSDVHAFRPKGIANAFGNIVYAFMVHHSIPSMIGPMKNKQHAARAFLGTFILVGCVYALLAVTAIYAFADIPNKSCSTHPSDPCVIQDLYTDNFSSYNQQWLAEFLTLFPVFTLTSNFPLISITLRNNLKTLFEHVGILKGSRYQHIVCCLLSPCPPLLLAFAVHDVTILVGVTGAYAGMFIMFIVPALLIKISRQRVEEKTNQPVPQHALRSPFTHKGWVYAILVFSSVSLVIITVGQILRAVE